MKQEFEWVSVGERLPDIITRERHLIVADTGGNVFDAFWSAKSKKFLDESMGMGISGITHWAEFPNAPKS